MNLRPRHYVLIVIILALGAFNLVRSYRARHVAPTVKVIDISRGTSPVWDFYDRAAALRDAPEAQFSPVLADLTQHIDQANGTGVPPQTSKGELTDLRGCRTWLLFYRQAKVGGGAQADWLQRSDAHVRACVTNHRDIAG